MNNYREIPGLPETKRDLLQQLVDQLRLLPGVAAVVLGGSHAAGTNHAASDLDVGIYYWEANPFAIPAIQAIANRLSVQGTPTVTGFYEWGAWVNGGAWIQTARRNFNCKVAAIAMPSFAMSPLPALRSLCAVPA